MKKQDIKDINKIIIHCSATKENSDYSFDNILRDHKARGFDTCGYHRFVRKDGVIFVGRSYDTVGAHAAPFNTNSIGICYEGGLNSRGKAKDTRTDEQKEQILNLIFDVLKEIRKAGGDTRKVQIIGHRDISPDLDGDGIVEPHEFIKMCPCFEAREEYKDITKLF